MDPPTVNTKVALTTSPHYGGNLYAGSTPNSSKKRGAATRSPPQDNEPTPKRRDSKLGQLSPTRNSFFCTTPNSDKKPDVRHMFRPACRRKAEEPEGKKGSEVIGEVPVGNVDRLVLSEAERKIRNIDVLRSDDTKEAREEMDSKLAEITEREDKLKSLKDKVKSLKAEVEETEKSLQRSNEEYRSMELRFKERGDRFVQEVDGQYFATASLEQAAAKLGIPKPEEGLYRCSPEVLLGYLREAKEVGLASNPNFKELWDPSGNGERDRLWHIKYDKGPEISVQDASMEVLACRIIDYFQLASFYSSCTLQDAAAKLGIPATKEALSGCTNSVLLEYLRVAKGVGLASNPNFKELWAPSGNSERDGHWKSKYGSQPEIRLRKANKGEYVRRIIDYFQI